MWRWYNTVHHCRTLIKKINQMNGLRISYWQLFNKQMRSVVYVMEHPEQETRHRPNVVLMLAHRLRRWTNIKTTLGQRIVFAGCSLECSQIAYDLSLCIVIFAGNAIQRQIWKYDKIISWKVKGFKFVNCVNVSSWWMWKWRYSIWHM